MNASVLRNRNAEQFVVGAEEYLLTLDELHALAAYHADVLIRNDIRIFVFAEHTYDEIAAFDFTQKSLKQIEELLGRIVVERAIRLAEHNYEMLNPPVWDLFVSNAHVMT